MALKDAQRRTVFAVASVAATAVLLPAVAVQLEWASLEHSFAHLDWAWVAAGCAAGIGYQVLRGVRFGYLLRLPLSKPMTATICVQAFVRKILPVWLGEAFGVWLFGRRHGIDLGTGTASFVLARTIDLGLVTTVLLTLAAAGAMPAAAPTWLSWGLGLLVLLALAAVALTLRMDMQLGLPGPNANRYLVAVRAFLRQMAQATRQTGVVAVVLPTVLASAAMWAAMYIQHYAFVAALGFQLSALDILWIQLLLVPVQLLPVRGVADLGTHEAAWFLGATIVGVASDRAAELGFGTHILAFLAAFVYLGVGLGIILIERLRPPTDSGKNPR